MHHLLFPFGAVCLASFLRSLYQALDLKHFLPWNLLKALWFCIVRVNLWSTPVDPRVSCEVEASPFSVGIAAASALVHLGHVSLGDPRMELLLGSPFCSCDLCVVDPPACAVSVTVDHKSWHQVDWFAHFIFFFQNGFIFSSLDLSL